MKRAVEELRLPLVAYWSIFTDGEWCEMVPDQIPLFLAGLDKRLNLT